MSFKSCTCGIAEETVQPPGLCDAMSVRSEVFFEERSSISFESEDFKIFEICEILKLKMKDLYFNIFIRQIIFTAHEILKLYEIDDLTISDLRRYICGK